MQSLAPTVLYGITGSGKTMVYTEMCKQVIQQGKNVLILYPEISLTKQMQQAFTKSFDPNIVHTYHSKQTKLRQKATWASAANAPGGHIFIGTRSALFLPLQAIGLIVVDEAHDGAYKQGNGTRYHGLIVAAALARIHKAKLLIGSATPPIQETHQIVAKGGQLLRLEQLAIQTTTQREYQIVDMTDKQNRSTASYMISKQLLASIAHSLKDKKQSLLFLNRKGTARLLLCENCGWHAECQQCEMPLIYHHDSFETRCNVCGTNTKAAISCPDCSSELTQRTPGIKAIEQELLKFFPSSRIARFDSGNKKDESFSENYTKIHDGEVDIIIGTQLITKGLDLPLLDTVGILHAESALYMPDFASEERAFQQLVQVSGRVGRGHSDKARVIIQTYDPKNKLFSYVKNQDWYGFYTSQLEQRKNHAFPPYSYLLRIWTSDVKEEKAYAKCTQVAENLRATHTVQILGPAPSFYHKKANKYYWQILCKSSSRKSLHTIASNLPADFLFDLDPISLL